MNIARYLIGLSVLGTGCVSTMPYSVRIRESEHSGICYVHGAVMKKERLRSAYGLIGYTKEYSDARVADFPFARRSIPGGCVVMTVVDHPELSSPEYGEAYVCTDCTAAKDQWMSLHPHLSKGLTLKGPNQALEPTAWAVTISADAQLAPANAVAHL